MNRQFWTVARRRGGRVEYYGGMDWRGRYGTPIWLEMTIVPTCWSASARTLARWLRRDFPGCGAVAITIR